MSEWTKAKARRSRREKWHTRAVIAALFAMIAFLLNLVCGCIPSTAPQRPPASRDDTQHVTIDTYHSQPARESQDTDMLASFTGPLQVAGVAFAGVLTNTDIALPLVAAIAGHVGVKFIERTSDAEFLTQRIRVPTTKGYILCKPDGTVLIVLDDEAPLPDAPKPPNIDGLLAPTVLPEGETP